MPSDLVYIYREKKPGKGKSVVRRWLGPCTVVGSEEQNHCVSKGGRCMLCAPEHMRPAEPEEISELVKLRVSLKRIEDLVNGKGQNPIGFMPEQDDDESDDDLGGRPFVRPGR